VNLTTILRDTMTSLLQRPVTVCYPAERVPAPAHLRGALTWNPVGCTGCGLCVKDCVSNAIELITIDKATKQYVIRWHADRCTYCSQCVQNCRFDLLGLSPEHWELAALNKQGFTTLLGDKVNVDKVLAPAA